MRSSLTQKLNVHSLTSAEFDQNVLYMRQDPIHVVKCKFTEGKNYESHSNINCIILIDCIHR